MNNNFFKHKIGIETHIRLNTKNKLFCSCENNTTDAAIINENICAICTGTPGILPNLNLECVDMGIKLSSALNCDIPKILCFDRKHYDFPDMGKMRQTTTESTPLGKNGGLQLSEVIVTFEKLALEEDAAQTIKTACSFTINDNRAGSPLMEITTSPCFSTSNQVIEYLKVLKNLCGALKIVDTSNSSSVRSDINISVQYIINKEIIQGERVEIKNMNSLSGIKQALAFEFARHEQLLLENKIILRETLGWNATDGKTYFMRSKEEENDYLFIPEYDIAPINIEHRIISQDNPFNFFFKIKELEQLDEDRLNRLFDLLSILDFNIFIFETDISKIKFLIDIFSIEFLQNKINVKQANLIFELFKQKKTDLKQIKKNMHDLNESFDLFMFNIEIKFINLELIKEFIMKIKTEHKDETKDFLLKIIVQHFAKILPNQKINFTEVLQILN